MPGFLKGLIEIEYRRLSDAERGDWSWRVMRRSPKVCVRGAFAITPAIILMARVDAYLITYWMMAFWGDVLVGVGEAAPSAHTLGPKK